MTRGPVSRLCSALLGLLVLGGGDGLPVVDSLIFHRREAASEVPQSHFEADSGCHADACTVRSTAQHARFAPTVEPEVRFLPLSFPGSAVPSLPLLAAGLLARQPHSRAPPRFG
jgi:hypothetical protein